MESSRFRYVVSSDDDRPPLLVVGEGCCGVGVAGVITAAAPAAEVVSGR